LKERKHGTSPIVAKALECLEKGASIAERGRINRTNLQTQTKNK